MTALADGSCFTAVSDEGLAGPRPRPVSEGVETGRGLHLVEGVAVAWGVWSRGRYGKTVWAVVAPAAP